MPNLSYRQPGLVLQQGASSPAVRDLQRDLRSLGYLRAGFDGQFGPGTESGVMALQYDLLHNDGTSTGNDGSAPVRVQDYNNNRVSAVTGQVDEPMAACISDILDDPAFPKLPFSADPKADNNAFRAKLAALPEQAVPIPFLLAILQQESGLEHYNSGDSFIVVGLDRNLHGAAGGYAITSRGYGAGQYTLFHHPPTTEEVAQVMGDPIQNVRMAIQELRGKFDKYVNGPSDVANDRIAEFGRGPLRLCKYEASDARYLTDCQACVAAAGLVQITPGSTPLYEGSTGLYVTTQYYNPAPFSTTPARDKVGCDWPYAVRRYNGSGVNSFWYQGRILNNVLKAVGVSRPEAA